MERPHNQGKVAIFILQQILLKSMSEGLTFLT